MSVIDDLRRVIQDLVAPDMKSLHVEIQNVAETSKLRDEALSAKVDSKVESLSAKLDSKFDLLSAKMDANHAAILYALTLDKRMEAVERKANATM